MAVHCSFIAVLSLFSSNFRLNYSVRVHVEQVRKSYHFLPILKFRPRARGTSFYSSSTVFAVISQFFSVELVELYPAAMIPLAHKTAVIPCPTSAN